MVCPVILQTLAPFLSGRELDACCLNSGQNCGPLAPSSHTSDKFAPKGLSEQGSQGDHANGGGSGPLRTSSCKGVPSYPSLPCLCFCLLDGPLQPSKPITGERQLCLTLQIPKRTIFPSSADPRPNPQLLLPVPHPQLIRLAWPSNAPPKH